MLRAFLKDSLFYAIPSFVSKGMALILIPLYTRVLSPVDYGALDLLLVFASLINLTIALEISQGVARFFSSESNVESKQEYGQTAFLFTVACYSFFLAITSFYSKELSFIVMATDKFESEFQVGLIYIWANGIFILVHNQFRWALRSKGYALTSLISSFTTAIVSVWLAFFLSLGLKGLLYGMLAGVTVGCIYGFFYLQYLFHFKFNVRKLKSMLAFSSPLVLSGIAVFFSMYIDRIMINHFLSLDDVGLYGMAFRLASVVGLVMVGFRGALTPLIYKHYKEDETPKQLALIFRVFIAIALMAFLFLSLFSEEILVLLTTESYYAAAPLVTILAPAVLLSNMYIFAPGIGIVKKTHLIIWINVIGAILNITFNWFFIPMWGLPGAAFATLLGYFCIFSAYMLFSQYYYRVPHKWGALMISFSCACCIVWGLPLIDEGIAPLIFLKASGLVFGLVIIVLTQLISLSEIAKGVVLVKRKVMG